MKKEKEIDVLDKLIENNLEDKDKKKVRFKLFYSQIIVAIITLILLIISFLNVKRSILFSYLVFNSTIIIPIFLYTALTIGFMYLIGLIIYYILSKEDLEKLKFLALIYKKLDLIRFIDLLIGYAFFMIVFIITPCNVVGDSMNNTLKSGDRVLTTDLFYIKPNNGDIVTFDCSNYVHSTPTLFIKRVVANEGSKIKYDPRTLTLYVNGSEVAYSIDTVEYSRMYFTALDIYNVFEFNELDKSKLEYENEFVMPKGKALVFGDNRGNSNDSEEYGAISTKDIFGHVLFRFGKKIEEDILY